MQQIGVLVVADGPELAGRIALAPPGGTPDVAIVETTAQAADILERLASGAVDVVVVDLDRLSGDGVRLVGLIRGSRPSVRLLGVTSSESPELAALVFSAGASGLVGADATPGRLADAIREVAEGLLVLPPEPVSAAVDMSEPVLGPAPIGVLTVREREILSALADGRSTFEIAASLGISPLTVQSHTKNLFAKLGVHSKVAAVRVAWSAEAGARNG